MNKKFSFYRNYFSVSLVIFIVSFFFLGFSHEVFATTEALSGDYSYNLDDNGTSSYNTNAYPKTGVPAGTYNQFLWWAGSTPDVAHARSGSYGVWISTHSGYVYMPDMNWNGPTSNTVLSSGWVTSCIGLYNQNTSTFTPTTTLTLSGSETLYVGSGNGTGFAEQGASHGGYYEFGDNGTSRHANLFISYSSSCNTPATPPPTCSDGILNQDETSIDRGGVCTVNITSNITASTTWDNSHLYVVSGDIEITTGHTLTIEPGTRIKFDDTTPSSIIVNGTLNAIGTLTGKIIFNSNATAQAPGDWGGITVGSGGVANFDYSNISDAGKTGTSEAGIYNNGGTISVNNSDIVYSENFGIKNSSGTITIDENTDIGFNVDGIYKTGGTVTVSNSVIHDNTSHGINNATSSVIDAEYNYWGDVSGPSGFGPGSGDSVSDYVDYDHWKDHIHFTSDSGHNSVNNGKIQWDGSTSYSEFSSAVATWNALNNISIEEKTTTADLTIYQYDYGDTPFVAQWAEQVGPDAIQLNEYYLTDYSSALKQNVMTHELGHALGLAHSYTGNVMYFVVSPQTSLGYQDISDYDYLWP